ncbi:MAG TPA: DNA primase [Gemmatirosa sp.]
MITPESIERVREAADIVEIVGEHVKLKRSGSSFRGPCPFHHGTGPNFSVTPRTNAYYCFVCHAKGDVIGFVRDHLGLDFVEAVKYVADRSGVEVQETRNRPTEERDAREPLWEANAAAAELFRATLWEDVEAQGARDYLASREITRDDADRFGLGYAWRDGARWVEKLRALGHDDARLLDAGLLRRRDERPDEPFPYYRGRLMLPIQDAAGRTVGFGGRALRPDQTPKYLNSPQGALFDKGRQLYGLSWAKHPIRKAERALVVEGYFDALRLALAGIEEAVAPLGTAMTESQATLLAKLTRNVFLVYDGDAAGLKAAVRSGHELLRLGVAPRIVSLPGGEDPDTYVRAHGRDAMEAALAQGLDLLDWQVLLLQRHGYFSDLHRTRRAIDKLLPTVRAASDAVTRDLYIARLAEVTRLDRDVLQREVDAPPQRGAGASYGAASAAAPSAPVAEAPRGAVAEPRRGAPTAPREVSADGVEYVPAAPGREDRPGFRPYERRSLRGRRAEEWVSVRAVPRVPLDAITRRAERELVRAMVQDRTLVEAVAEKWQPEAFHEDAFRELFARLLEDPDLPLDDAARGFPDAAVRLIDETLSERDPSPELTVASWLVKLQVRALDNEKAEILRRLTVNTPPVRDDEKDLLITRMQALQAERAALSPTYGRVAASREAYAAESDPNDRR